MHPRHARERGQLHAIDEVAGVELRPDIGGPQHDLALSPSSAEQLAVANDFGVWRSADAGLSWTSLNQALPNLPVRRILSTPLGGSGARILIEGIGWPGACALNMPERITM